MDSTNLPRFYKNPKFLQPVGYEHPVPGSQMPRKAPRKPKAGNCGGCGKKPLKAATGALTRALLAKRKNAN